MEWEITFLAIAYLLLGLDSLWIDWMFLKKNLGAELVTEDDLATWIREPERKILILVPAWKESKIIQGMLRGNLGRIQYQNFLFLVGCYPNDMPTCRAVLEIAQESDQVLTFMNEQPGPTSKGQLLNRMVQEAVAGNYGEFDIILFQDAEDIIHPLSLKLVNSISKEWSFIQLPVFSFPISRRLQAGAVYMEEFAESHTRDLLVRSHLHLALPSAGVGTAITKRAVQKIMAAQKGQLLDESCLTEDYCLGVKAHTLGISQTFVCRYLIQKGGQKDWIATREYFPRMVNASLKQKARWIQGIALESALRVGWFGSLSNKLFLWRDRKALLANSLGILGLFHLPLLPWLESLPTPVQWLLPLNGICFLIRFFCRHKAYQRVYQRNDWFWLLLRYPLSIVINGTAGFMALKKFSESQWKKEPSPWIKTEHEIPIGFGQLPVALRRGL